MSLKIDMENPTHIAIFAVCMIALTLAILLVSSVGMHIVHGQNVTNSTTVFHHHHFIHHDHSQETTLQHDNDPAP